MIAGPLGRPKLYRPIPSASSLVASCLTLSDTFAMVGRANWLFPNDNMHFRTDYPCLAFSHDFCSKHSRPRQSCSSANQGRPSDYILPPAKLSSRCSATRSIDLRFHDSVAPVAAIAPTHFSFATSIPTMSATALSDPVRTS